MIQHHDHLKKSVDQLKQAFQGPGFFQKIYSTSWFLCITIRFPGSTKYAYLGRGSGVEGVWPGEGIPMAALRVKDRYLEYMRKHLAGALCGDFSVDPRDRILVLSYFKKSHGNFFQFFWCGRHFYFLHYFFEEEKNQRKLFLSWEGEVPVENFPENDSQLEEKLKSFFNPLGRKTGTSALADSPPAKSQSPREIKELLTAEYNALFQEGKSSKMARFLERKRANIQKDLEKNGKWKVIWDLLPTENLERALAQEGLGEINLLGVVFKFPKPWSLHKKLDFLYQKTKRLKMGEDICLKRLQEVEEKISTLKNQKEKKSSPPKIKGPVWFRAKAPKKIFKEGDPNRAAILSLILPGGILMAVGKTDTGNDYLRNSWGKGEDFWFHLEGYTGAHGVVRASTVSQLDENKFRLIGSIIADVSKVNLSVIPLVYTQLKNVKGVKGKAGMVIIKKQKFMSVLYKGDWKKDLLED